MLEILLGNSSKKTLGFGLFSQRSAANGTNKYFFLNDTIVTGTALSTSTAVVDRLDYSSAIGNYTKGIFSSFLTPTTTVTRKYTYASDSVSDGGNLTAAKNSVTSVGNLDIGLIVGGQTTTLNKNVIQYTYSDDTAVNTNSLTIARDAGTGVGNSTIGVIAGSTFITDVAVQGTTQRCIYGQNTFVNSTALPDPSKPMASFSTSAKGYMCGRSLNNSAYGSIYVYNFATNAITSGLTLINARRDTVGAGDKEFGLITGGAVSSSAVLATEKMNLSNESLRVGTSLRIYVLFSPGLSSTPGSF